MAPVRRKWDREPSAPTDLLTKLLIFVRTPEEGYELNDYAWCNAAAVSGWTAGWVRLADGGYIEVDSDVYAVGSDVYAVGIAPEDILEFAIRFTRKGLNVALDANESPYAKDDIRREEATKTVAIYQTKPGWGIF